MTCCSMSSTNLFVRCNGHMEGVNIRTRLFMCPNNRKWSEAHVFKTTPYTVVLLGIGSVFDAKGPSVECLTSRDRHAMLSQ